jgi:hypothetical protein
MSSARKASKAGPGIGNMESLRASFCDPDDNYLEERYLDQLDDLSSDDEACTSGRDKGQGQGQGQSPSPPLGGKKKKKEHWVDPERQVDRELLAVCQGRVRRRAELIAHIRSAYLSDVVLLKSIITQHFNEVYTLYNI